MPVQDIDSAKITEFLGFEPERQMSILKKMPPELKDRFKSAVMERKDILAKQAAKYPTKAEGGNPEVKNPFIPDANTPWNVAKGAGRGVENLAMTVPRVLADIGKEGYTGAFKSQIMAPIESTAEKAAAARTAGHPWEEAGYTAATLLPLVGPWAANLGERAGSGDIAGAGAELGTTFGVPHAVAAATPSIADLKEAASRRGIPEKLQARAEANKVPLGRQPWQERALIMGPASAIGYALGGPLGAAGTAAGAEALALIRRSDWYRNMKAGALEKTGQALDIRKSPVGGAVLNHEPSGPIETTATPRTATADQFKQPAETSHESRSEATSGATEKIGAERPTVAPEVAEHFNLGKEPVGSPLDLETTSPLEALTRPDAEHEAPTLESDANPRPPNWKSVEDALAPSGNQAKRRSQTMDAQGNPTPFGRKLVEIVPEITSATKATAPEALMTGFRRVLQDVSEAENQIPEGTTVDTVPITSSLFELSQEYMDRGLSDVAKSIDKIREQWTSNAVPWGEFLARKRSFFQNHNLRSAPMKRAYGILMEASSRISPELSEANSNYSTVRRALDNANVDVNTGRRISEVGKAPTKSSSVSIGERATPKSKPAVQKTAPVKTPAEARELLHQPQPSEQPALLGESESEAMTKAAAGRRPELLKEGKEFDQTRLVESPLFQGRGGPQGFLGTDARAEEPTSVKEKIGGALPDPAIEASAASDMEMFARDIRDMQSFREGVGGGGATTMESNAEGKSIEEDLSAEWSKVGKSLGAKPPKGLEDMTPGRIAKAIEKGSGKDFERVKSAFMAAAKEGFSAYRESQRESGTGPGELRRRALEAIRKRPKE